MDLYKYVVKLYIESQPAISRSVRDTVLIFIHTPFPQEAVAKKLETIYGHIYIG